MNQYKKDKELRQKALGQTIEKMTFEKSNDLLNIVKTVNKQNQKTVSDNINDIVATIYKLSKEEVNYINSLLGKY